jgi:hypothetical protein
MVFLFVVELAMQSCRLRRTLCSRHLLSYPTHERPRVFTNRSNGPVVDPESEATWSEKLRKNANMAMRQGNKALCLCGALLPGGSRELIAWIYSERLVPLYKANKTKK